jgi:hypothetical protein
MEGRKRDGGKEKRCRGGIEKERDKNKKRRVGGRRKLSHLDYGKQEGNLGKVHKCRSSSTRIAGCSVGMHPSYDSQDTRWRNSVKKCT